MLVHLNSINCNLQYTINELLAEHYTRVTEVLQKISISEKKQRKACEFAL